MKNVTVTLPEEIASWLRAQAAENGRSLSRWLADLLERMRRQEGEYETAMVCALALAIQPNRTHARNWLIQRAAAISGYNCGQGGRAWGMATAPCLTTTAFNRRYRHKGQQK